jgi:hypothetical protein
VDPEFFSIDFAQRLLSTFCHNGLIYYRLYNYKRSK